MKALLIIFFSSIYLYGFFWVDSFQNEKTKEVINKFRSIDLYYTIQAKKQVEATRKRAQLSLNATYNDTIDDENIITYRTVPYIADLYSNLFGNEDQKALDVRGRLIFNSIDQSLVNHDSFVTSSAEVIDFFDSNVSASCATMVNNPKFSKMFNNNISDIDCIEAQARHNAFYKVGPFSMNISNEDILQQYQSQILFEDSLNNSGLLGKNSELFMSKYRYSIEKDRELSQKINYFTYDQLLEYANKYISTNKTFISKEPIIEAMKMRVSVLQDNNASASLIALNTLLDTYTLNEYNSSVNFVNTTTNTCLEQKSFLEATINTLQNQLTLIQSDISTKESEIATWQGQESAFSGNPTLYIIWQTQLDTLMAQLISLNNQRDTMVTSLSDYQTQLYALGC
jgi:nitrogen fixation/metabolism regulation signal transduction histidine kinase